MQRYDISLSVFLPIFIHGMKGDVEKEKLSFIIHGIIHGSLFFSYVVYFVPHPSTNLFIRLFISSSNNLKNFNHNCIISAVCVFPPFRPL